MSSETVTSPEESINDAERQVLLSVHEQLREEIRGHGQRKGRRFVGTFTTVGVIVGYAFTPYGDGGVLGVVPYVLAFYYLSHISSQNYVAEAASILARIEKYVNQPGFEYEYHYGGFNVTPAPYLERPEPDDWSLTEFERKADRLLTVLGSRPLDTRGSSARDEHHPLRNIQLGIKRGMCIIAAVAFIGFSVGGSLLVGMEGVPKLGIETGLSGWLVAAILFASQLYIGYKVSIAYLRHRLYVRGLRAATRSLEPAEMKGVRDMEMES